MSPREQKLHNAATALLDQLSVVHNDGRYMSVWQIAQLHIGQYMGPKYDKEMLALAKLVKWGKEGK